MELRIGARIVLALAATLYAPTLCTSASAQEVTLRRVLTIHLGAENFPSNPILDAGIREALATRSDIAIDYSTEYLESDAFPGQGVELALRDYIRRKYQGRKIDVVIAMTDTALRFALEHRTDLFPDAPIVFSGLVTPDESTRRVGAGVTGMNLRVAYRETLRLALALHPSTERVFVVAKGRDNQTLEAVRTEFRDAAAPVEIIYLAEETIPALLAAVKAVPPQSLILYIWHSQQDPGLVVFPDEVARLVAQAAPVPVFGSSDLYIGAGVVGGVVRSTRDTGIRIGEMALQVLTGARAQDLPIETARVVPILDWRQLRRWGVSERRVPKEAIVRFREPSVWERYKVYILGAITILLAQAALIAGLLIQRAKRREAEEQVRESYQRIRDLGARLLNAQETERSRIARELHDDISQQMALLTIDLELLGTADQAEAEKLA